MMAVDRTKIYEGLMHLLVLRDELHKLHWSEAANRANELSIDIAYYVGISEQIAVDAKAHRKEVE